MYESNRSRITKENIQIDNKHENIHLSKKKKENIHQEKIKVINILHLKA